MVCGVLSDVSQKNILPDLTEPFRVSQDHPPSCGVFYVIFSNLSYFFVHLLCWCYGIPSFWRLVLFRLLLFFHHNFCCLLIFFCFLKYACPFSFISMYIHPLLFYLIILDHFHPILFGPSWSECFCTYLSLLTVGCHTPPSLQMQYLSFFFMSFSFA